MYTNKSNVIVYVKHDNKQIAINPGETRSVADGETMHIDLVKIGPIIAHFPHIEKTA
jgi:hypothetical protein